MTNDNSDTPSWLATTPTWLHLLLAIISLIAALTVFLMQTERRFTLIEERQQQIRESLRMSAESAESFRREAMGKLDTVSTQMTLLTLEFAKHQARYENALDRANNDPPARYKAQP